MKLIVKNFGPIKNVEINSKQLTIFIGPQAAGKSVLAKLLTIFQDIEFIAGQNFNKFLKIYNIEFLNSNSFIKFQDNELYVKYFNGLIETNFEKRVELDDVLEIAFRENFDKQIKSKPEFTELSKQKKVELFNEFHKKVFPQLKRKSKIQAKDEISSPLYIPTERIFVASISDFLYNFIKSNINLPESTINFGARFENARREIPTYRIPFFENVEYSYENNSNKLKIGNNKIINFTQSSSGMQSVIPMALVIEHFSKKETTNFVIEEPELNLYPTTQKKVVEFITEKCLNQKHNLIVTTHSPYILTSFANLIEANNTAEINPEAKNKVLEIIPEKKWIDFKNVSAYYINNGKATDILDYENKTIDANAIDDVSDIIAEEFDTLLNIKYGE